ncbi:MAG: ribosomal protection-like ABC-F family protein [Thermoplasmatota archaeon]
MSRLLVAFDEVSLAYGGRSILHGAKMVLGEGERAALVGPNGAGKTTILNLIAGRLRPDVGDVGVDHNLRYAYLTQIFDFPPDATVGSLLAEKPAQVESLEADLRAIEARMADPAFYEEPGYEEVLQRYGELQREVATLTSKADAGAAFSILQELGMGEVEPERRMREMSGGQKTRVLLARALANHKGMDLLMLDEPSNHLDIETVEWLEEFLTETYEGALLLVAHDRYLMDSLATKILEIDNRKIVEWDGNFSDYEEQKQAYVRAVDAQRRREVEEVKRQWAIIEEIKRRNRYDAQARSKTIRLERARRTHTEQAVARAKSFNLRFASVAKSSNDVARIHDLAKSFPVPGSPVPDVIFDAAELTIQRGDKIGLIGPNGCGKTTLLRMITGLEKPDGGRIEVFPGVRLGYFDQEHAGLDPTRTLIEEIRSIRPERRMPEEEARGILGRFLFKGDDAFKVSAKLSGGEKARLALAKFIVGQTNFLVLDEPTNHLDLASQEIVEKALAEYDGTLLVVSHDRHFLDAVVNKVAVVARSRIGLFPGNFSSTRTLTKLAEFTGANQREYIVRRAFKDYGENKRYSPGERVLVTGGETQTKKQLLRLAIERGWLEAR